MADREETPPDARAGTARAVVVASLGCGLLAGLLEVAILEIQNAIDPQVTVESIRTNHHYSWMIPASALVLFTTVGLLLGLVGLRWPKLAARLTPWLLGGPLFLGPLLAVRGLYPIVCVLLAVGLVVRLAPMVRTECPRFRRRTGWAVPALLALVAVVGWAGVGDRVSEPDLSAKPAPKAPADAGRPAGPTHRGPNVLLLVMDTVRSDHLSLYGYGRATTPNLQRWAERGVVFTGARSTAPWTLPSHASMLTGRWPHELSADVSHPLDDKYPTLAEVLADRGYATGGFVANTYYCNAWYGLDRGFDRYEDFPENVQVTPNEIFRSSTLGRKLARKVGLEDSRPGEKGTRKTAAAINAAALRWIDAVAGDRPFFAFLNYYDAHGPFEPPDGHTWRFGPGATDPSARISTFRQVHDRRAREAPGGGDQDGPAAGNILPGGPAPARSVELLLDAYDECIASLDAQIGSLLDNLDHRGLLGNTVVLITSDHGEHFGDRGLFGHGHSLYAPLIDVPLVILPPRDQGGAGRQVREPVSLRDLAATAVDVAGLSPSSSPFPGRSLARFWQSDAAANPAPGDPPLSEVEHQRKFPPSPHVPASIGPLWSVNDGSLVFIRDSQGREQLFDRATDPAEVVNLANQPERQADVERLRATLDRLLRDGGGEEQDGH